MYLLRTREVLSAKGRRPASNSAAAATHQQSFHPKQLLQHAEQRFSDFPMPQPNMMKSVLAVCFAGLSAAAAFQVSPQHRAMPRRDVMHPLKSAVELSPIDEMCIENVAEFCLHESCDIEEYEALVNQLEEQKTHYIKHVATVESLLVRLKDSNHPEHDPNDVKTLIEGIRETLANPPSTSINSATEGL